MICLSGGKYTKLSFPCFFLIQFRTAIFAIFSFLFMSRPVAMRTFHPIFFTLFPYHCCRHNPCRDSDNRITDQHHDRRQEAPDRCHRRYVSVADSRHRHDRPIDAVRNIIELQYRADFLLSYTLSYRSKSPKSGQKRKTQISSVR